MSNVIFKWQYLAVFWLQGQQCCLTQSVISGFIKPQTPWIIMSKESLKPLWSNFRRMESPSILPSNLRRSTITWKLLCMILIQKMKGSSVSDSFVLLLLLLFLFYLFFSLFIDSSSDSRYIYTASWSVVLWVFELDNWSR